MDLDLLVRIMQEHIPFNRVLGVRAVSLERGLVRLMVPFRPELVGDPLRPALHGGVISALADAAGGAALWSGIDDDHGRVSTIDLRIDYLRPARLEDVLAEGRVVRLGKRVGVADIRLFHASREEETIATGKGVYNVLRTKGAVPEGWK
ncbi:MAG: hotdog fold thioesterase [Polyangiaceae bacterium]|jgi:uncharacterized protein (TIGR00369 family)